MKKALLSYLSMIPSVAGVELYLGEENLATRYAILKRKGNTVQFEKGEYHLDSITKLKAEFPSSIPVALTISGKGLMHRSLETVDQWSANDYARKILPNASLDDFYIQTSIKGTTTFVSLIRKSDIAKVLKEFNDLGIEILSVTLGPFALLPVWSYVQMPANDLVNIDAHMFMLKDGSINGYRLSAPLTDRSAKIRFAGEEINECLVTAYATGLCLMADIDFPTIDPGDVSISKDEYHQRSIFKKAGIASLAFFLIVLLTNLFLFGYFSSKIDDYGSNDLEVLKAEERELRLNLSKNEELLSSITRPLNNEYGSLTRIADLLAVSQPVSIVLDDMSIFPSDKASVRKARKPVFDFSLVKVSGTCTNGQELNAWLTAIRQLAFCKKVEIGKYTAIENGSANFTLNLFVN